MTDHEHKTRNEQGEEMCCEDGKTAAEHRAESPDGKCCVDE